MLRKRIIKHGIFSQIGSYTCIGYKLCSCNNDSYCACDEDRACDGHVVSCQGVGCTCD